MPCRDNFSKPRTVRIKTQSIGTFVSRPEIHWSTTQTIQNYQLNIIFVLLYILYVSVLSLEMIVVNVYILEFSLLILII